MRIISAKSSQLASASSSNSNSRGTSSNAGGRNEKLAISEPMSGTGRLFFSPRELRETALAFIQYFIGASGRRLHLTSTPKEPSGSIGREPDKRLRLLPARVRLP